MPSVTLVDGLAIAVAAFFLACGLLRGLRREVAGMVGRLVAAGVALAVGPAIGSALADAAPSARLALAATAAGLFALAFAIEAVLAPVLALVTGRGGHPSIAGRIRGGIAGLASAAVLVGAVLVVTPPGDPGEIRLAATRDAVLAALPQTFRGGSGGREGEPSQAQDTAHALPPRPVAWITVRTADRFDTRTLPGTVRAAERAPIGFDVGGRVATVEVEIGEAFAAGDVLATLDETQLGLRVEERRSALAEAEAALAEAEADHRRTAHLLERGVESEAALDEAAAARAATRSRVAAARARLASARRDLADAQLRAPWDGRVAVRRVEPSERVAPGEPVLEIQSQHGGLELVVSAPETVVEAIARHERHAIRAPAAPGRTFAGRVSDVGARARGGAGFPVEIAIAPPAAGLRPGMSAEVTLKLSAGAAAESVAIPVTAYLPGPDGTAWAFVVDRANGTLERRAIALGGLLGRAVFVTDGLAPGETIVTKGLGFLREGQKVSLLGEGPRRFTQ